MDRSRHFIFGLGFHLWTFLMTPADTSVLPSKIHRKWCSRTELWGHDSKQSKSAPKILTCKCIHMTLSVAQNPRGRGQTLLRQFNSGARPKRGDTAITFMHQSWRPLALLQESLKIRILTCAIAPGLPIFSFGAATGHRKSQTFE